MKFFDTTSQYLHNISTPVWWICFLLVVDFFLLNRFVVPYSIVVDEWSIDPISILTVVVLAGLWWFYRERPKRVSTLAERISLWALLAWFLIAFLTTLAHPRECSPNYGGLACLATIGMWMLPVFMIPTLKISTRDIKVILWTYLTLCGIGILMNVGVILLPKIISGLVGWEKTPGDGRAFLPLGVSTVLGCVYAMGIPVAIGLYYQSDRSQKNIIASIVTCLLLIIGVFATGSRASVAVTLAVLMASFAVIGRGRIHSRGMKISVAAGLLAVVLGVIIQGQRYRFVSFYDGSIQWRLRGSASALQMLEDRPLFGSGIERLFHRCSIGRPSYLLGKNEMETVIYRNRLTQREPHNLYLLTAAETGVVGLVFLLLYLGSTFWIFISPARDTHNNANNALLKGMAFSIAIVLLQSITESMLLARPRFAILVGILWGVFQRYARLIERNF